MNPVDFENPHIERWQKSQMEEEAKEEGLSLCGQFSDVRAKNKKRKYICSLQLAD